MRTLQYQSKMFVSSHISLYIVLKFVQPLCFMWQRHYGIDIATECNNIQVPSYSASIISQRNKSDTFFHPCCYNIQALFATFNPLFYLIERKNISYMQVGYVEMFCKKMKTSNNVCIYLYHYYALISLNAMLQPTHHNM